MNRYDLGLPPALAALMNWVPTVALAGFVIRTVQTRRWLNLSIIPSFAVAWIVTVTIGSSNWVIRPYDLSNEGKYLNVLRQEQAVWNRWRATGEISKTLVPDVTIMNWKQEVPLLPFNVPLGSRFTYSLISPSLANPSPYSKATVADFWRVNGNAWANEFPSRLAEAESNVARLRKTPLQRFLQGFTWPRLVPALGFFLSDLAILALVNALALAIATISDRRPIRRA